MTNVKSTKKALIASILSLCMCFSMLLGTTFAWFTDSVTSANNVITAGNLDVELYYQVEGSEKWEKVTKDSNIFKKDALWEPGYTEVVKLKVVNEGSLDFRYQLGVNVDSEIPSINQNGDMFFLSDYINYGVIEGAEEYTRDTAIKAVADVETHLGISYSYSGTLEDGKEQVLTMVVYMPTTVGNEANYAKNADVAKINLGINVFATQVTGESDSFGDDYDANAPFSVWDGTVPTDMPESLVVDGETQTVHVKDAAAFAYLSTLSEKWREFYTDGNGTSTTNYRNGAGANYYYSGKWTVSLEADIDLGNHAIDPVDIVFGENCGYSAFNGNNHTIRNINTTTGLFENNTRANFANLVLENVKATNGALIGKSNSSITNVTVKNATISGTDYVGGLVGAVYSSVQGCKVINSSVTGTGKEAGGLIGYAETNSKGSSISNNTVENVTVYAGNRAAGLVAQPNVNIKVYNNIIDTVTVGAEDTTTYKPGAVVSNALAPENVYDNKVIGYDVVSFAFAESVTDLKDALGDAVNNGETEVVVDVNGAGINFNYGLNTSLVPAGTTVTIRNAVVSGKSYGNAVAGTVIFENCTFTNIGAYSIHFDAGNGDVIFRNCTLEGWCSFGSAINSVTMENCTIKGNGTYGMVRFYQNTTMTNCTVDVSNVNTADGYVDGISAVGAEVVMTDCDVVFGEYEIADGGKIIIDGATVITDAEDLAAALTADEEEISVILVNDIECPISSLGTITGGSGEYKLGGENTETITIDLNGKKLNITTTYWSNLGAKNDNAIFTIKNGTMTSSQATGTWNSYDLTFSNCDYVIENVTFEKAIAFDNTGKKVTMKDVTINETHDYYALWITAAGQTVEIDGLTINSAGRGIKIDEQYVGTPAKVTLKVSNAKFTTVNKAAIMVKSVAGADIAVDDVDIAGVVADTTNVVWVDEDAAAYADLVTVTGGNKIVED